MPRLCDCEANNTCTKPECLYYWGSSKWRNVIDARPDISAPSTVCKYLSGCTGFKTQAHTCPRQSHEYIMRCALFGECMFRSPQIDRGKRTSLAWCGDCLKKEIA